MGDCSVQFDTLDSLDYLIPPVKKSHGTHQTDLLFSRDFKRRTDIKLIKDFRKKITRRIKSPSLSQGTGVHTSSSVILKETTKEVIHEHLSFVNSNNKNFNTNKYLSINKEHRKNCIIEDKPMIKVTVIPKATETQTSKVFNKRRERTKKLQSTVSNQESSIKNQNINYFMVKGKRCEKVYEIKSTESTNLSYKNFDTKYEDISIQQITNSKRLINSLNMDKKKRRNKKTEPYNYKINNFGEKYEGANARKSRVTIVGQLGLSRDDQYVLKCAATVNDKPIATNYVQLNNTTSRNLLNSNRGAQASTTSKFKPTGFSLDYNDDYTTRRQDSNVQTDICYANNCMHFDTNRKEFRSTSQATQVNLNGPINKSVKLLNDKISECYCNISNENNDINVGTKDNVERDCKSPLVIISVYQRNRHDNEDNSLNPVKIIQKPMLSQKLVNNIEYTKSKEKKGQKRINNAASVNKSPRSRSPSPATKTHKTISPTLGKRNNTNTPSPQREQTNRNKNSEVKSKHKVNNSKKDKNCYCPYSLENQEFMKLESNSKAYDTNQNDTKQVKRALVNNFLRSVCRVEQTDAKMKHFAPKSPKVDTSRIAININGDRDRYDVLLEQSNFDTGLSVRKTIKGQPQRHGITKEAINSMENDLLLSKEIKNSPIYLNETREIYKPVRHTSRLNVRDSLEISHSRDLRAGTRLNPTQTRSRDDFRDSFINTGGEARVKHYRGDKCSIPDPNVRDKQIRELLGIVRIIQNPINCEQAHKVQENQEDKYCTCCKKRSSKEIMTEIISKLAKNSRNKCNNQGISITSPTRLKSREANKIEGKGTEGLHQTSEVCTPQTCSDTVSDNLLSLDKQCVPDKQENKFLNEDLTADVPHNESFVQENLILNRNVQVFLQIEQFTKQKPIHLTRKQYEKVKKIIHCTLNQRKCCNLNNCNIVSVGEIKVKPRLQRNSFNREVQTEISEIKRTVKCIQIQTHHNNKTQKIKNNTSRKEINQEQMDKMNSTAHRSNDRMIPTADRNCNRSIKKEFIEKNVQPYAVSPRKTASSLEIHYANVAYLKNITISSTHFGDGFQNIKTTNDTTKPSTSLHTIFKGHRKSATPNLGTSAYSLCSDAHDATKSVKESPLADDSKPKKPFLQRLLSCLVMRSRETTDLKEVPDQKLLSVNSSIDSYHLSTSLGALEMTSTLFDTSGSFYSNHTIAPRNKMKRGFLSSVRGFLTTRKS